jgi:hypothetical protein
MIGRREVLRSTAMIALAPAAARAGDSQSPRAAGFTGHLAHEFVPTRDPMTSLREAVFLCDV